MDYKREIRSIGKTEVFKVLMVGKYKIFKLLGKGSNGSSYLATIDGNNYRNIYVIKILTKPADYEVQILKYISENNINCQIPENSIVTCFKEEFKFGDKFCIVMNFIGEYSNDVFRLSDFIQNGKVKKAKDYLEIFNSLLNQLNNLHKIGVIHNDIKPDNIIINGKNQATYIDFGSASICKQKLNTLPLPCMDQEILPFFSTPDYILPELQFIIIKGKLILRNGNYISYNQGLMNDKWSLGIVFYLLVNQRLPYYINNPISVSEIDLYIYNVRTKDTNINYMIEDMPLGFIEQMLEGFNASELKNRWIKYLDEDDERTYSDIPDYEEDEEDEISIYSVDDILRLSKRDMEERFKEIKETEIVVHFQTEDRVILLSTYIENISSILYDIDIHKYIIESKYNDPNDMFNTTIVNNVLSKMLRSRNPDLTKIIKDMNKPNISINTNYNNDDLAMISPTKRSPRKKSIS